MGDAKCCGHPKGEVRRELQWLCPLMRRRLCLGAREKDEGTLRSRKRSVIHGTEEREGKKTSRQNSRYNGKLENWRKFLVQAPLSLLQKNLNKREK